MRCDKCDKWMRKMGIKISDAEYTKMHDKAADTKIWLCNPCLNFQFRNITNERLVSSYQYKNQILSFSVTEK